MARKPLLEKPTSGSKGGTIGRPRKQPPANAKEIIQDAAAHGFTLIGIAQTLGVSVDCLRRWMDDDPDLRQSFAFGREAERRTLHNKLYRDATEGKGKDSMIAAMFLLKSRHGYKEGSEVDTQSARVQIEIKLPGALAPAQYAEVIDHECTETLGLSAARNGCS